MEEEFGRAKKFVRNRIKKIRNKFTTKSKKKVITKNKRKMKTPWDNSVYGNPHTIVARLMRPRY